MSKKNAAKMAGSFIAGAVAAVASIGVGDLKIDTSKPEQARLVCYSYTPASATPTNAPASWAMSVEGCPKDPIHNTPGSGCKRIDAQLPVTDDLAAACVRYGAEKWNAASR